MRNRLVVSVAVVAAAVAGAGTPAVVAASADLTESQRLVTLSELNAQAVVLAHSLADERDTMTRYVAGGRTAADGSAGVSEKRRARVDRQLREIRENAPASLERRLAKLTTIRQQALGGPGPAADTYDAYTETVQALNAISADLARRIPPRASGGAAEALPDLGRAVEQAAGSRTLALGDLAGGGGQPKLTADAQRIRVQEEAALADFRQNAFADARESYDGTVNGSGIEAAERYLEQLTDQPRLSAGDLALDAGRVDTALSGRIDLMRAVESALTTAETARLAGLRDDDVTALELRIALLAACVLIAVGAGISGARSMTRPLAVLRLGARRVAADPVAEEPVRFTGRDDEYADVVRAVNELREKAVGFHETAEKLGLVGERQRLADQRQELEQRTAELAERLAGLRERVHGSFVNLSMRTLSLIERQLGVIEGLEDREQDPERLDTLYRLDHLATRMRRYSENLLVMAGVENGTGHTGPVPLLDVLRASVSEIERYERVRIQSLPPHSRIAGFAADAVSHLVAELLENATAFSPPDADVELSGWLLESGEVMLSVHDEGIGITADRLAELNARLRDPDGEADGAEEDALGLGLYVVARLAARHGLRVELRDQKQGGVAAVVVLPTSILPTRPAPANTQSGPAVTPGVSLPGSVAEVNSNSLPRRRPGRLPQRSGAAAPAEAGASVETGAGAESVAAAETEAEDAPGSVAGSPATGATVPDPDIPAGGSSPAADTGDTVAPLATDGAATAGTAVAAGPSEPVGRDATASGQDVTASGADVPAAAGENGRLSDGLARSAQDDPLVAAAEKSVRAATERDFPVSRPESGPFVTVPRDYPAEARAAAVLARGGKTVPEAPETPEAPATGTGFPADDPYGVRRAGRPEDEHSRTEDAAPAGPAAQAFRASAADAPDVQKALDAPAPADARTPAPAPAPADAPGAPAAPASTAPAEHATPGEYTGPAGHATPAGHTGPTAPADPAPARADSATAPADPVPAPAPAPAAPRLTDRGLPKRTPKVVAQREPVQKPSRGVDAEGLRRRLGGFRQGALEGLRDAEAEAAVHPGRESTGQTTGDAAGQIALRGAARGAEDASGRDGEDRHRTGELDAGGTVEEERG